MKKTKPKKKSIRQLIKTADRWFSKYIRLKAADANGYVQCVTCGKAIPWNKGCHAGHFVVRQWVRLAGRPYPGTRAATLGTLL